jgi:hypothetical protein
MAPVGCGLVELEGAVLLLGTDPIFAAADPDPVASGCAEVDDVLDSAGDRVFPLAAGRLFRKG